jgi:hypothetical protein
MKTLKIVAIAAGLLMVLMMVAPTFAVNGPLADHLQYKFYTGQTALFTGLLNNEIDIMAWPLTYAQYNTAIASAPNVTVAPYFDLGDYEIAFNNNMTDPSHMADRKAMNYTEFRQAVACLIDKDTLVGTTVNNFGTRIDTAIPRPILNNWVDLNPASPTCVSKYDAAGLPINKYPWDYNTALAITILWNNNWYSHVTYPNLAALIALYPSIPANSVVYPPGHPRAGTPIDPIVAYIRSDHLPRKTAGENLIHEMNNLGMPNTGLTHEGNSAVCYTQVFINHDYDFYTAGWSFGVHPLFFYSSYTPVGIYPGGPNLYMIDDWNMTYHATQEYPLDTLDTPASSAYAISMAKMCQYRIVQEAMLCPLYTSASYMAYRTGAVGVINFRGYGLTAGLEYTFMNAKVAPYSHTPPPGMVIRYGTLNPPEQINPIFSSWVWDYEVCDRIFNGPMNTNPYNPTVAGKSPAGSDQPWMAYDWNYQLSNFNGGGGLGNPADSYTQMANVTYWFRHDIQWQDGYPWTVDDFNYTIYIDATYGDSWGQSDMMHVVNFIKWDDWTCSLYFDIPTFWALYTAGYDQVPKHIYEKIDIPAGAEGGGTTTGHHGFWPGKDALSSEVHGLTYPITPEETWVGTGMWIYVPGTLVQGTGGGLTCNPYPGFWMNITQGDIDFRYYWNAGPPPQGGSYMVGGVSDFLLLANAYGTSGIPPVPFKLGGLHVWEPGADLAPPASVVGQSDLVAIALNIGKQWGSNAGGGGFSGGGGGGSDALISVTPELVELGPADSVGQNFTVAVVVQNVTQTNVSAGLAAVEVHLAWNATLLQPLSYIDKLGVSGGVLAGPLLYTTNPGFFDDAGNKIATPPYTGATNYKVAAVDFAGTWWGNGTVAEITFQAICQPSTSQPPASCTLELGNAELDDREGNYIGFQRQNGQYMIQPLAPDLYVAPSEAQITHGVNFNLDIGVLNVTDLYAYDMILRFDPSLLQVYDVTEGSFLKSGGTTKVFLNEVNQTEGTLQYVVTLLSAPTGVNGSGTLFTVTLTSDLVNNGTSTLSFQNTTELTDSHVNLIQPYDTEESSITVVDVAQATCNVMVGETEYTILMVSNSSVPLGEHLLYDDSNKTLTFNLTGPSGYPGFCNVTIPKQVMNGTYAILVNGTAVAYTQTENATHYILNFTYSQGFNQIKVLLTIWGDINGDRKVSLQDLVLLANAYGSTPGSPRWDARCDVYRDNRISLQDLVVLALNYNRTYP